VNWVLLIAGQFNGRMLLEGVGNADVVLADVDVDVGLAGPADDADEEVAV
jgi:hypothetical protein